MASTSPSGWAFGATECRTAFFFKCVRHVHDLSVSFNAWEIKKKKQEEERCRRVEAILLLRPLLLRRTMCSLFRCSYPAAGVRTSGEMRTHEPMSWQNSTVYPKTEEAPTPTRVDNAQNSGNLERTWLSEKEQWHWHTPKKFGAVTSVRVDGAMHL